MKAQSKPGPARVRWIDHGVGIAEGSASSNRRILGHPGHGSHCPRGCFVYASAASPSATPTGEERRRGESDSLDSRDCLSRTTVGEAAATIRGTTSDPDLGSPLQISEVRLRFPPDQSGSVVAYASCLIDNCLVLNDIRIERGRLSGLVLVYPSKASSSGRRHSTFNPVTRAAAEALRQALLGTLGRLLDPMQGSDVSPRGPR
ncbi:MAG: septation protein SpoVG family protein [Candidatus Eisenbacteria sp.]|nr:septation protein SpoVG family protein [Candidatus Eisenbacteria bacterium]